MNSPADLLRRAAVKLRATVMELPEPWSSRPWRVVATDTESADGIASCARDTHDEDPMGAYDCCWSSESLGHERVAALAVLMHPPVALALADWLEQCARILDRYAGTQWEDLTDRADHPLAVARAILREQS